MVGGSVGHIHVIMPWWLSWGRSSVCVSGVLVSGICVCFCVAVPLGQLPEGGGLLTDAGVVPLSVEGDA